MKRFTSCPVRRRQRRFSLIELVVAMAVMMVMGLIIGTAGSTFYNSYRRSVRNSKRLREFINIDRVWGNGIKNMVPLKWLDSEGESRFVFRGEENRVLFTTLRRADGEARSGFLFIRIWVEEDKLMAEYSPFPRLPWKEEDEEEEIGDMKKEVLAENVAAISFRYAEDTGEEDNPIEWYDVWEEEEHSAIPLAIQLKVEFTDGSSEIWLRRAAGISGRSTFGKRTATSSGGTTSDGSSSSGSSRLDRSAAAVERMTKSVSSTAK